MHAGTFLLLFKKCGSDISSLYITYTWIIRSRKRVAKGKQKSRFHGVRFCDISDDAKLLHSNRHPIGSRNHEVVDMMYGILLYVLVESLLLFFEWNLKTNAFTRNSNLLDNYDIKFILSQESGIGNPKKHKPGTPYYTSLLYSSTPYDANFFAPVIYTWSVWYSCTEVCHMRPMLTEKWNQLPSKSTPTQQWNSEIPMLT